MIERVEMKIEEEVKAKFINENYLVPSLATIYSLEAKNGRFYHVGNGKYRPSTTTIIGRMHPTGIGLLKWYANKGWDKAQRIYKVSGHYGTYIHTIFTDLMNKCEIDTTDSGLWNYVQEVMNAKGFYLTDEEVDGWMMRTRKDVFGLVMWARKYEVEPIAIEMPLIHPSDGYGSCLDLVAWIKPRKDSKKKLISLIDWKSGDERDDHPIQLESYMLNWNQNFPSFEIEALYNYYTRDFRLPLGEKVKPYEFKRREIDDPLIRKRWIGYLDMFMSDPCNLTPEIKPEIRGHKEFSLKTDVEKLIQKHELKEDENGKNERQDKKGSPADETADTWGHKDRKKA